MSKKWSITLLLAFLVQNAFAGEVVTTVFNVIESQRTERILVLSGSDGRIYKAGKSEENLKYYKSLVGQMVKLTFAEAGKEALITNIQKLTRADVDPSVYDLNHFQYNELRQFAPSDLQSTEEAAEVFNGMLNDGDKRRSQCFKRAHMWAFDMWSKLGLSTQKIFIFWTKRYSMLEEFEWWFHVAPLVVVKGQDYVFDGTFFNKPVTLEEWRNYFMKKTITCPVMEHYKTYEEKQWTKLCFLMKVPMYQFSPLTIQNRDLRGVDRNQWVLEELQDARRAFKNFNDVYEGLDTGKPTITH